MPEEQIEYKFDTQLLIEGSTATEDEINDYITEHFEGDCLIVVGDEELMKLHYHTNSPWKVLEYCASLGRFSTLLSRTCSGRASTCTVRSGGGERPHSPFYAGVPPCTPEVFAGLAAPSTHHAGVPRRGPADRCRGGGAPSALPHGGASSPGPRGDFLMRRKSPKTHQEPPGSWTSSTRGRTPLDSPPPALAVLVVVA